jgi:sulfur carrier protein
MSWSSHLAARVIDFVGTTALRGRPRQRVVVSPPMSGEDVHVGDRIQVVINGQPRAVARGTTVAALISELGLGDRRVAVERNREVVPRAEHATTLLAANDRLELVTFVGGG